MPQTLPLLLLLAGFHIDFKTFLGGSLDDLGRGIAVDSAGYIYITGTTDSGDFPFTTTVFGFPADKHVCPFAAKLTPDAKSVVWAVCLSGMSAFPSIAVDSAENVYVLAGSLFKLSPDASRIIYSVALGGATALAVDSSGNASVVGSATQGIPTTPGAFQPNVTPGACQYLVAAPPSPCPDAFVMKLAPDGTVVYATYLGGSGQDIARGVAVDSHGNVWITGDTASPDFPMTPNAFQSKFHGEINLGPLEFGDAFVAELYPSGSKLLYSTYLGGTEPDAGLAIAVDANGAAYVAGATQSSDFPVTKGVLQSVYSGPASAEPALSGNGFIATFSASGALLYSTYTPDQQVSAIAVDAHGEAFYEGAATDVLSADASTILHTAPPTGAMTIDASGAVYLAQATQGYLDFSTPGTVQPKFGGGTYDAAITKLDFTGAQSPWVSSLVNAASLRSGTPQFYPVFQVAPGEIISIFGTGFDASTRLLFDGIAPPILYAQSNQINAVVPFEINPAGTVTTLQSGGETFGPGRMDVYAAVPGIFTANSTGTGQAAVLNQDGSVNSQSNPAARGSVISVFMTGAGAMTPAQSDGSLTLLTASFPLVALGVSSNIGPVTYSGAAPGFVAGAVQVNVQISQDTPAGDRVPLVVYVGNFASGFSGETTIAVR